MADQMSPADVPAEYVRAAFEGIAAFDPRFGEGNYLGYNESIRATLAAVLPVHEQQVRAQVDDERRRGPVGPTEPQDPGAYERARRFDSASRERVARALNDEIRAIGTHRTGLDIAFFYAPRLAEAALAALGNEDGD